MVPSMKCQLLTSRKSWHQFHQDNMPENLLINYTNFFSNILSKVSKYLYFQWQHQSKTNRIIPILKILKLSVLMLTIIINLITYDFELKI